MSEPFLEPILRWFRLRKVTSQIPHGARLLDVGCGRSARFLKTVESQISYGVGIDFKVVPLRTAKLETIQTHLDQQLPFADSSFDVVTMLAVLEHIEHEKSILSEIRRVLRQDGKLVLTVPSVWAQPVLEFLSFKLKIVDEMEIKDHKRYYNRKILRQVLVDEIGFRNFQHHYFQLWMNNFCAVVK